MLSYLGDGLLSLSQYALAIIRSTPANALKVAGTTAYEAAKLAGETIKDVATNIKESFTDTYNDIEKDDDAFAIAWKFTKNLSGHTLQASADVIHNITDAITEEIAPALGNGLTNIFHDTWHCDDNNTSTIIGSNSDCSNIIE